jgi:hypothetical protein
MQSSAAITSELRSQAMFTNLVRPQQAQGEGDKIGISLDCCSSDRVE